MNKSATTKAGRRYQQRRRAGLCPMCGGSRGAPLPGRVHCRECATIKRDYMRRVREDRFARGVCIHCAKREQASHSAMCPRCLGALAARRRAEKDKRHD